MSDSKKKKSPGQVARDRRIAGKKSAKNPDNAPINAVVPKRYTRKERE